MIKVQICDMSLTDLSILENNLLSDFDDFWSLKTLQDELSNPNSKYIIAKNNNNILGFAGIWKSFEDVHITNIVVRKNLRGQGIGSLLLEKLINISKTYENITSITLEVNIKNLPAIKLYEKYNFKKVGIRKKYYLQKDDALIMTMEVIK